MQIKGGLVGLIMCSSCSRSQLKFDLLQAVIDNSLDGSNVKTRSAAALLVGDHFYNNGHISIDLGSVNSPSQGGLLFEIWSCGFLSLVWMPLHI